MAMELRTRVPIAADGDVLAARHGARELATELGLSHTEVVLVVTAVSEIARNIVNYAVRGEMSLGAARDGDRIGVIVIARDQGPGIPDMARAMQDGYSTGGGLGLGLPGAKRLMDEFELSSDVGKGTTVTMTKWVR
jgi:serine/threonine-protein kinase RsbT